MVMEGTDSLLIYHAIPFKWCLKSLFLEMIREAALRMINGKREAANILDKLCRQNEKHSPNPTTAQ